MAKSRKPGKKIQNVHIVEDINPLQVEQVQDIKPVQPVNIISNANLDIINDFWSNYDNTNKKKETQLERYIRNNASESILRFVKLGGGPALGSAAEKYARYIFTELSEREDSGHDHIIKKKNTDSVANITTSDSDLSHTLKIEQKTSTLDKHNNYMWQHIASKHNWNILLLTAIGYNEITFYALNRTQFDSLVLKGKITNQGNKAKDSEQGLWLKFSDVKDDLIKITTSADIIKLYNDNSDNNDVANENINNLSLDKDNNDIIKTSKKDKKTNNKNK